MKPLDIEFMKQLHDKINIIPVIGKADTMTPEEVGNILKNHLVTNLSKQVASFKTVIMEQIAAAKIKVYEFPEVEDGEEAERKENRRMKVGCLQS